MASDEYKKDLYDQLQDDEFAAEYLKVTLTDYEDFADLALGLKDVIEARGGVATVAEIAGLERSHLYKILRGETVPGIDTLNAICKAVNLSLSVEPINEKEAA
jgi:probable addiction module antidote protein